MVQYSFAGPLFECDSVLFITGRASRKGVKWRGPDDNVRSNLAQYGLEDRYLDVMVSDASRHRLWRMKGLFDAIITDRTFVKLYSVFNSAFKIAIATRRCSIMSYSLKIHPLM